MKRMLLGVVMGCALLSFGASWGQETPVVDDTVVVEEMAAEEVAAPQELTIQQQLDELRAKITELEAKLAAQKETVSGELYAITDAQSKLATGEKVKLSGYIQGQFTSDEAAEPETDFRVRRARLKIDAPISEMASLTLQFDASRSVETKDAYLDLGRTTDRWRFRIGQAKVPFMYEVLESSGNRLEPERTVLAAVLFPGERDQGAWVQVKNALGDGIPGAIFDLGYQNGNVLNTADNNDNKDLVARLRIPIGKTPPDKNTEADSVYVGFLTGELTDKNSVTTDKQFLGGGFSKLFGPIWLRGEVVGGEILGKDFLGWYAHGAYEIPNTKGTIFARYEQLDEDRDTSDNLYRNTTVGYQHMLDSKTRIIAAYDIRNPDEGFSKFSRTDGNMATLRLQVKY